MRTACLAMSTLRRRQSAFEQYIHHGEGTGAKHGAGSGQRVRIACGHSTLSRPVLAFYAVSILVGLGLILRLALMPDESKYGRREGRLGTWPVPRG